MSRFVNLDANASAPLRPVARAALVAALDAGGNASSIHACGRAARAAVETARRAVAMLVGAEAEDVVFTSGASEAASTVLAPSMRASRALISAVEHPCMRGGGRFEPSACAQIPVEADGRVDPDRLAAMLGEEASSTLVAIQAANGETGVMQPVAELASVARKHGAAFVCDASQAAGRIDLVTLGRQFDALILSSHKLGGPQGAGAVVLGERLRASLVPLVAGGGQERGLRGGTENVAAIAGFGAAAEAAWQGLAGEAARIAALRDRLEARLVDAIDGIEVVAAASPRLPNTSALAFEGVEAQMLVIALDLAGFAVSAGSACSSGRVERSHVLDAMRLPPSLSRGTIRVSLSTETTEAELDAFAAVLPDIVNGLRARRAKAA